MTTQSKAETVETDNGTDPETGEGAGTEPTGSDPETGDEDGKGTGPTEEDGRLKKLRKDLDAKTARIAELEAAEAERQRAEMSETDRLKAENADLNAKLDKIEADALRSRIAKEHGLPAEFAERLKGTTEEELKADAEQLANLVPAKRTPPPAADEAGIGGKADPAPTDPLELHRRAVGRF